MALLPFSPYGPDVTDLNTNFSSKVQNVFPRGDGYGPVKELEAFTQALPGACRGGIFARNTDGSITIFAATATNLYKLSNTDFSWSNVSKGGGPYTSVPSTDNWQFVQFNTFIYATQVNTVVQVFDLSSPTAFADLGGSPPQAGHIAIVNQFVVLSGLTSNPQRVQWCDQGLPTVWTAGTGQADFQDLFDGGLVHGVAGGDNFGVIFQDAAIRMMVYAPGDPAVFQIRLVSRDDGLYAQYSAINAGDRTFFCSPQGFKMITPGGYPTPIGKERVDRTFFADIDQGSLRLVIGANDPTATRVYWCYKSISGVTAQFDKILAYDWVLERWGLILTQGEYLFSFARPSVSLEALDAIANGTFTISGATNNGSGAIRLTLDSISNAYTNLANENTVVVYGVVGTTEANATWHFSIIDPTHIDLTGSTFSNTYSSGGHIGGSLDALPFSLDSLSVVAVAQLGAIDATHAAGFFTGQNLEGIMETTEQDGQGQRMFISAVRPMTDAPNAVVSLAVRNNAQTASVYQSETSVNAQGICPQRIDTRYARAKLRVPAGDTWTYAMGVEPDFTLTGTR